MPVFFGAGGRRASMHPRNCCSSTTHPRAICPFDAQHPSMLLMMPRQGLGSALLGRRTRRERRGGSLGVREAALRASAVGDDLPATMVESWWVMVVVVMMRIRDPIDVEMNELPYGRLRVIIVRDFSLQLPNREDLFTCLEVHTRPHLDFTKSDINIPSHLLVLRIVLSQWRVRSNHQLTPFLTLPPSPSNATNQRHSPPRSPQPQPRISTPHTSPSLRNQRARGIANPSRLSLARASAWPKSGNVLHRRDLRGTLSGTILRVRR